MQSDYIFILILTIFHIFQFLITFLFTSYFLLQLAKIKLHSTKKIYENGQIYKQNSY